jgi:hypothetical protein
MTNKPSLLPEEQLLNSGTKNLLDYFSGLKMTVLIGQ